MKKLTILLLALALVLGLAACAPKEEPQPPVEEPVNEPAEEPVEEPAEEPAVEEKTEEVVLFFGNNEYIMTGDEQYEWMLTEVREITYGEICLEEAIVRALMAGPMDTDKLSTGFTDTIQLISVDVLDGTAYVNFASEGLHGGSMQESYVIGQVVESLTQLDSVDRVQFLVDGQEAETLMGHMSIEGPIEAY
ncbi:MAG TPA: GerMN domain-containing protein [Gudongella oleilytica]|jgi:spore germination protein GerM|nr:GerMN domain-containing protein [Gudongella oleilytica]